MRAGELNRRLHLQKAVMVSDAEGVSVENWSDVDAVWAHISPARAVEAMQGAQPEERITHQITIRWRSDVSIRQRFLYRETSVATDRIFLIHTLLDTDEAHRQIDCMCEEIVTSQIGAT